MESFIEKIFDIDRNAEDYQKQLEAKKQKLLLDRKEKLNAIDEEYNKVLEEEQENLKLYLSKIIKFLKISPKQKRIRKNALPNLR